MIYVNLFRQIYFELDSFNGILTSFGLFSAEIWFICKCLIIILTTFTMFYCIFKCSFFFRFLFFNL